MNHGQDKLLYQIALTKINGIGDVLSRILLQNFENEKAIFDAPRKSLTLIPGIATKLVDEIKNPEVLSRAEKELDFIVKNNIQTYFINNSNYPSRLKECSDSPVLFYFKGNANLDEKKIISIVGTRHSSNYGNGFCNEFIQELSSKTHDILIVSGLAYGIDISAHKAALESKIPTIGVMAHGLDRLYPQAHRPIATEMLRCGGLLTEFPSNTEPDKFNFVKRNRIIAGIADAVIVVESGAKGGSLITAEIANSYCKDVFAVPGKTSDKHSIGCNKLIADHKADIFYSTDFFLQQMGWDEESLNRKKKPTQKELFLDLSSDEQNIINIFENKTEDIHIDQISLKTKIPVYQLFSTLLSLEIKGIIKNLPGNFYNLT